jgi:hypothetical protein
MIINFATTSDKYYNAFYECKLWFDVFYTCKHFKLSPLFLIDLRVYLTELKTILSHKGFLESLQL